MQDYPKAVGCPFYRSDDGRQKILCEGLIDGSSLTLTYVRGQDFRIQREVFCCEHYDKCEIYTMLMSKYES